MNGNDSQGGGFGSGGFLSGSDSPSPSPSLKPFGGGAGFNPQPQPTSQPQNSLHGSGFNPNETETFEAQSPNFNSGSSYNAYTPPTAADSSSASQITSAPHLALIPGLVFGIVSVALSLYVLVGPIRAIDKEQLFFSGLAWFIAAILGISSLGLYFSKDTALRSASLYQDVAWKKVLYFAVLVLIAIGTVLSAFLFAQYVGKQ